MRDKPPNHAVAEHAIRAFLEALGYDVDAGELVGTPARVVEAYLNDLVVGERIDVEQLVLRGAVPSTSASLVIVSDITVMTMCPHHLLPAQGQATVAYLPGTSVLGLGTVSHLVNACSRRLTLQEGIGQDVTRALMHYAGARGAYCSLRLEHACLRLRGARQACAVVDTVHTEGLLNSSPYALQLAVALNQSLADVATP
jgi:GTP cyclohydrolase I